MSLLPSNHDRHLTSEEYKLLRSGKTIACILLVRKRTGMDLKNCKKVVDKFRNLGRG